MKGSGRPLLSVGRNLEALGLAERPTQKHGRQRLPLPTPAIIRLKRILVPVDFSRASVKPIWYASALAGVHGGRIVLLHVTEPITFCVDCGYGAVNRQEADTGQIKKDRSRLSRFALRHLAPTSIQELVVRSGEVGEQIVATAKEMKTDLIILYAHDTKPGDTVHSPETAARVIRSAPCPVLVVRIRELDFVDAPEKGAAFFSNESRG
jgi:nucleotide-binding universal stress UspA family protein